MDADSTVARVTLEGLTDKVVQVNSIEVRVTKRAAPTVGSYLTCPGRGEGPNIRSVVIDLDSDPPAATTMDQAGAQISFSFTVQKGHTEIFDIAGLTNKCTCEWVAIIKMSIGGAEASYTVHVAGQTSFKTTPSSDAKPYQWINGKWVDQSSGAPSPAGPASAPEDIPGPVLDICNAASSEAASVLPQPIQVQRDSSAVQPGASGTLLRHSGCSFVVNAPPPKRLPPGGVVSDSMNAWLDGAKTSTLAKEEFNALVKGYSTNGPGRTLQGAGNEAVLFDGVFVARTGRFIVTVQVVSTRKEITAKTETAGRVILRHIPPGR